MDEITTKWNKTGLLDNIDNELDKTLLANNLQEGVKVLIEIYKDPRKELKVELFLPIIVRLFNRGMRVVDDMPQLYKCFSEYFDMNYDLYEALKKYDITLTAETEFCEIFVSKFENKEISYV